MDDDSSSLEQLLESESSSIEQIQIEFEPLILVSEPISVSNNSFALFMLPEEILLKISGFAGVEAMRNLVATCKYIRNQLDTSFLLLLASENYPDRATSGFIVDAIGNEGNTCLWRNAKFLLEGHAIPKDLSIHLFSNTTAEKISSDEVRSMIIQVFGSPESYVDVRKFLKFLFSKVSFNNLKCLMLCGVELSSEFSQEIGTLNLNVFHMRNFRYHTDFAEQCFFLHCNSLETLYVVHPGEDGDVIPPYHLKKLVLYCPKSSKDIIEGREVICTGLINLYKRHALKEM